MKKMDTNQSNSEENQEEIVETEPEGREITDSEDIELDVLEAYNELKDGNNDDEGGETPPAEAAPEAEPVVEEVEEVEEEGEEEEVKQPAETFDPPASWKAEEKEWFYSQPPEAQREFSRRGKDLDNKIHEYNEKLSGYSQRYAALEEAIAPYREHWHGQGMREDQAIMSLAAADKILNEDLVSGLDFLAKQRGTTIQEVAEVLANGHESTLPTPQVGNNQNTAYNGLQEQLQYLTSKVQEQEQAKERESQQQELSEIHELRDEKDLAGRFLRPEMHDEAFAKEQLIPMYQNLKAQQPNQSPKTLMEQAYRAITGKVVSSPSVGLSSNNNKIRSRNSVAARSVRGSAVATPKEAPQPVPDSVEETLLQEARALGMDV